ncbi:MAG TPA: hypothetical protein VEC57_00725 [Candidatus Limnocylindrales bacterium]|nr:hypothetical protein [Candidatus Limnocylindrales bacterium]
MEALFAHTYLLLFGKLAVGGLIAMAVPPFAEMERGFYKSTCAVYLLCALLLVAGQATLRATYGADAPVTIAALLSWCAFSAVLGVYFVSLFLDLAWLRARAFAIASLLGLLALAITAASHVPAGAGVSATIAFAVAALSGAFVTGASSTGMLLGHWYLIDTGLDLQPLHRMTAFYRASLRAEIVAIFFAITVVWLGGDTFDAGLQAAFGERFGILVFARVALWALALVLAELIRRTLAIPQTMAATGLFYIAALVVAVGEIAAHWLLFRTGLPF